MVRSLCNRYAPCFTRSPRHNCRTALTGQKKTATQAFVSQRSAFFCGTVLLTFAHTRHSTLQETPPSPVQMLHNCALINCKVLIYRTFFHCLPTTREIGLLSCHVDDFFFFLELNFCTERLSSWMEASIASRLQCHGYDTHALCTRIRLYSLRTFSLGQLSKL